MKLCRFTVSFFLSSRLYLQMPFLLGRVDLLFKRKEKKSALQASEIGSQTKIWSLQSKRYIANVNVVGSEMLAKLQLNM